MGALLGMALGGLVADHYGWRTAFLVAGAPGLVLALVVLLGISEPRGGAFFADLRRLAQQRSDVPRFWDALKELLTKKSFPLIAFGSATGGLVGFVHSTFFAAFMLRTYPDQLERLADDVTNALGVRVGPIGFLGVALGLVSGVMGILGALVGGWASDLAGRRSLGAYMVIPAGAKLVSMPLAVASLLVSDVVAALVIVGILNLVRSMSHGPALSSVYALVRPELRPTAAAVLVFVIAIVGLGIGPIAVGLLSDALSASGFGERDGLRFALVSAESLGIVGAILFLLARPIYLREAVT